MAGKRSRKGKQGKGAAMMMMMPSAATAAADTNNNNRSSLTTTTTTNGAAASSSSMTAGAAGVSALQQQQQPLSMDEMELILTSEKRRGVYHCDYCHSDISQLPRIRCAVCPEFDLCLDCFTTTDHAAASRRAQAAVETQNALQESANRPNPTCGVMGMISESSSAFQHDGNTHGYRVCDSTRFPLFPNPRNVSAASASASTTTTTSTTKSMTTTTTSTTMTTPNSTTITCPPTPPENTKLASINEEKQEAEDADEEENCAKASKEQQQNSSLPQDDDAMDIDKEAPPPVDKDDENNYVDMSDAKKPAAVATATASIVQVVDPAASTKASEDGVVTEAAAASIGSDLQQQQQQLVHTMDADIKAMWTVEEDLRLLEGIKTHGLGNWVEISEAVSGQGSTGKSPRRCMERYFDDFLGRYGHILPPYTLIMEDMDENNNNNDYTTSNDNKASNSEAIEPPEEGTRTSKRRAALMRSMSSTLNQQSLLSRKKFRVIPTESIEGYEHVWPDPYLPTKDASIGQEVGRDQACKAEQLYVKTIASLQSQEEVERIRKEWAETKLNRPGGPTVLPPRPDDIAAMSGAELAGFMPRRGDFDVEWENDAEQAVADMEFIAGESEEDKQLKLQVLAIYNSRLHERERRKEFVLSRKLWDYRKLHQAHQKLPRDERDLVHRMRLFERFHTPAEHQKFIEDLLKAKRLRKEIARLQMYRRMGIRTLAEAEKYELDKTRRQYHKMVHPQKESDARRSDSAGGAAAAAAGGGDSGRHASWSEASSSSSLWKQYQYRTTDRKVRRSINRGASGGGEMEDDAKPPATEQQQQASPPKINAEEQDEKNAAAIASDKGTTAGSSTGCEGLLSPQEVSLCATLNLSHDLYITIRKTLIFESLHKGLLDKESTGSSKRALVKLDIEQRDGIIDFFLTAGWVSTKMSQIFRGDHQPKPAEAS